MFWFCFRYTGTMSSPRPLEIISEGILTAADNKLSENSKPGEEDGASELQNSFKQVAL